MENTLLKMMLLNVKKNIQNKKFIVSTTDAWRCSTAKKKRKERTIKYNITKWF